MKKRNLTFAVLLLAVVCTAFGVSGTYARYITSDSGTGKAKVASWSTKFLNGTNELSENFALELSNTDDSDYVVDGYIAPASSVYNDIKVSLAGTEVATEVVVSLDSITGDILDGDDDRFDIKVYKVTTGTTGETETLLTKVETSGSPDYGKYVLGINSAGTNWDKSAYTADDDFTIRVKLAWNQTFDASGVITDTYDSNDTTMGEDAATATTDAAKTLTANLTLTARQYIDSSTTYKITETTD